MITGIYFSAIVASPITSMSLNHQSIHQFRCRQFFLTTSSILPNLAKSEFLKDAIFLSIPASHISSESSSGIRTRTITSKFTRSSPHTIADLSLIRAITNLSNSLMYEVTVPIFSIIKYSLDTVLVRTASSSCLSCFLY